MLERWLLQEVCFFSYLRGIHFYFCFLFLFNASWRLGPCSFIPEVSHAIIIKQRNRNLCDTGSVRKSRKINGFTTTFRLHNGYNPSIEFIIIGQSRHEKDLVLCLMRILARCVEVLRQFDFPLKGRSELFEPRRGEFWAETLSFLGKADCLRTSASWHLAANRIPALSHGSGGHNEIVY